MTTPLFNFFNQPQISQILCTQCIWFVSFQFPKQRQETRKKKNQSAVRVNVCWYLVGIWSVCVVGIWLVYGRYVWLVFGWYMVGMCGWYLVGICLVYGRYVWLVFVWYMVGMCGWYLVGISSVCVVGIWLIYGRYGRLVKQQTMRSSANTPLSIGNVNSKFTSKLPEQCHENHNTSGLNTATNTAANMTNSVWLLWLKMSVVVAKLQLEKYAISRWEMQLNFSPNVKPCTEWHSCPEKGLTLQSHYFHDVQAAGGPGWWSHLLCVCEDLSLINSSKLCIHFQILFIKSLPKEK